MFQLDQGAIDGLTNILIILAISFVIAKNEFYKLQSFENHERIKSLKYVTAIRNGQVNVLISDDLLVGDILMLKPGDYIPADGICIKSNDLKTDESFMTGERDPIVKVSLSECKEDEPKKAHCFLFSGSIVSSGSGIMMVAAVGKRTCFSHIMTKNIDIPEPTPLQYKLQDLGEKLGKYGLYAGLVIFFGQFVHLFIDCYYRDVTYGITGFAYHTIHFILVSITVGIFGIPEGLPVIVSLGLAHRLENMANDNSLVVKLEGCENAGILTEICMQPQSCLTKNRSKVDTLFIEDKVLVSMGQDDIEGISQEGKKLYSQAVCANTDANLKELKGALENIPHTTDCALLEVISKFGYDFTQFKGDRIIRRIVPPTEDKKTISLYRIDDKSVRVFVRGSTKEMLGNCVTMLMTDGAIQPIDDNKRKTIHESYTHPFAERGQVLIVFGYKDIEIEGHNLNALSEEELSQNLSLICIVGVGDALRPETIECVKDCQKAGLNLRMITHDVKETAVGLAVKAGILVPEKADINNDNPYVMDGKTFRSKVGGFQVVSQSGVNRCRISNPYAFEEIVTNLKVLYEANSEDKLVLTVGLQNMGRTVGITGSNASDIHVLKNADVGYALNLVGSDLVKNGSGIVILDDSFGSLVRSICWGRNLYDCIMKYIQFALPFIFSGLALIVFGSVCFGKSIINPSQLLWSYLVLDTLSALAFMTEQPSDLSIKKAPYSRTPDFISPRMKKNIVGQTIYQVVVLIGLVLSGDSFINVPSERVYGPWKEENGMHFTLVFNTFIFLQLFNQIHSKLSHPYHAELSGKFFNNTMFLKIQAAILLVQILVVQYGGRAFYCAPLSTYHYFVSFFVASGSVLVHFICKIIPNSTIVAAQRSRSGDQALPETEMTDRETTNYDKTQQSDRV